MIYLWLFLGVVCALHLLRQPRLKVIYDGCGEPYLIRFYLFHFLGFSLKLHIIIRSDAERELHDHPWDFVSWIISGGYFEETPKNPKTYKLGHALNRQWIPAGAIRFCKAPYPHRLELENKADPYRIEHSIYGTNSNHIKPQLTPAITLVLTTPRFRAWGFYGKDKWIPHNSYLSEDC